MNEQLIEGLIAGRQSVASTNSSHPLEELLTAANAAKILRVSPSYVKAHCGKMKPHVPHIKLGAGRYAMYRFRRSDLVAFIEQQTSVPLRRL